MTTTRRPKEPPKPLPGVYQRGAVWWIRYRHNGKQHHETSKSTDVRVANKMLTQKKAEITTSVFVGPDVNRTTFDDLVTMIRDDYTLNGRKSADRVNIAVKQLRSFFGGTKARDITTDRVAAYVRLRLETDEAARATIRYELAVLGRMFTLAVQSEKAVKVPHIPSITVDNARQGFFEAADFAAVVMKLDEPLKRFAQFLYYTGWRAGEAKELTWADVDLEAGIVRLEPGTTKNNEGREFPIGAHPTLKALLKDQLDLTKRLEREQNRIITHVFHRNGEPIRSYAKGWNAATEAAGMDGRIVHDLRRTAVRNLERAGVSRSVAMKLTGHKTEAVYRRYAITSAADLSDGVAKVAILHDAPVGQKTVVSIARRQNEDNRTTETRPARTA